MRLAVFTAKYPARIATFFERDMQALLAAGVELEIFSIRPLEAKLWHFALDEQHADGRLRERSRHLSIPKALRVAAGTMWRSPALCAKQAAAVLPAAGRFGPVAFAKTAYVLPKAWAWAAERAHEFDHVLAYWGNYSGTCAWAFHQMIGRDIPFSIWLHAGTDLYSKPIYLRDKLLYADNVITCCDFNRGYIERAFPDLGATLADRLHVCHHGLDLNEYPFEREGRVAHRIVAVGRLSKYKGFEYLLRAVALLRLFDQRITLDLVGGGELQGTLELLARELGIGDAVRFRGWVEHPEARQAMREAHVLVHPSDGLGDGLPNVIREAMALGTPVIASDVAGIPDAIGDGRGVLVLPRRPDLLALAIRDLLADPAECDRIARAARRRVEGHYDVWQNGARLARLLTSTQRRGVPAPAKVA
jgi:colanic acid/amylovoran biosynthesis glycosyltransferase